MILTLLVQLNFGRMILTLRPFAQLVRQFCDIEGDAKQSDQCDVEHDYKWILHGLCTSIIRLARLL